MQLFISFFSIRIKTCIFNANKVTVSFKNKIMKKAFIVVAAIFITATVISSCSATRCPAYSQHETEQTDQNS